jgi:hypothetical protein
MGTFEWHKENNLSNWWQLGQTLKNRGINVNKE